MRRKRKGENEAETNIDQVAIIKVIVSHLNVLGLLLTHLVPDLAQFSVT